MRSFKLKIPTIFLLVISLTFAGIFSNGCTFNPVSLLKQPAREQQQIEIILEGYMASMQQRDTGLPYLLFSTHLQGQLTENELAHEFHGPGYLAYCGFESLRVISLDEILLAEDDTKAKQVIAEIHYDDGETGLILATFIEQEEELAIDRLEIFVSPGRTCVGDEK